MKGKRTASVILFSILLSVSAMLVPVGMSCKDIVVRPPATAGDYSLLLKVRDPSRPGLQVLTSVPKGTSYTYHHPWTGTSWEFTINHSFFGVATVGDTFPNIIKAGMVCTDAGLAFGDADTGSRWRNPTQNAWDDFDWMRYAYQTADTEQDAIRLLTTEAVDQLHATRVSENLFVVGPQRSVIIEADAVRYFTRNITALLARSNYPVDLWRTQLLNTLPVAPSYDTVKETWARAGTTVHLQSLCGVRVMAVGNTTVTVRAVPSWVYKPYGLDSLVNLSLGQRATVGSYSVRLLDLQEERAKLSVCTEVYSWEQELLSHIQPRSGNITVDDMMEFSRFHAEDLDGHRPMCEDRFSYEAALVCKIPNQYPTLLSSGWFAANHACSSIYVPVHICDTDIYEPYQTGEAAALCLELLHQQGHGTLTPFCEAVENVFLFENEVNELLARIMIENGIDISPFLTAMDTGMQEQAYLTELLWLNASNATQHLIQTIWMDNYTTSFQQMTHAIIVLQNTPGAEETVHLLEQLIRSISVSQMKSVLATEKIVSPLYLPHLSVITNV